MKKVQRIKCPPTNLSKKERVTYILAEFQKWAYSEELLQLIALYNHTDTPPITAPFLDYITWLKDFAEKHWDYRKKQKETTTKDGEAARWLLKNDELAEQHKDIIFEAAISLGLVNTFDSYIEDADYILPLGGARLSNLQRCRLAKQVIDQQNTKATVVALSTYRPIATSERESIDIYAPNAVYEYDAIIESMNCVFLQQNNYNIEKKEYGNSNSNYALCSFENNYKGSELFALAAPSSLPEIRRANSADCFDFFFQKFSIPEGTKIINCTSQIYCPYQGIRAFTYAIKYNVLFDTIGYSHDLCEPVAYLQEIKATIDAMFDFLQTFSV